VEKVNKHIERLLAYHDYVVVPDLGGFVVQKKSAQIYEDKITAPQAVVGFNPLMNHADGLLAIEVARAEGVTYRAALEMIGKEVAEFKRSITEAGFTAFGGIGSFKKTQSGSLEFKPAELLSSLPENFCMNELYVTPKSFDIQKAETKIVFTLPRAKTFRYAAAASLIFGMLLVSPQIDHRMSDHSASMFSMETFKPMDFHKTIVADTAKQVVDTVCSELVTTEKADGTIENNDSALYHVVVASLGTKKIADQYCSELKKENYECSHVLSPSKTYRVAIRSFADRNEAIAYMENLRKTDDRFKGAWVLCK